MAYSLDTEPCLNVAVHNLLAAELALPFGSIVNHRNTSTDTMLSSILAITIVIFVVDSWFRIAESVQDARFDIDTGSWSAPAVSIITHAVSIATTCANIGH